MKHENIREQRAQKISLKIKIMPLKDKLKLNTINIKLKKKKLIQVYKIHH